MSDNQEDDTSSEEDLWGAAIAEQAAAEAAAMQNQAATAAVSAGTHCTPEQYEAMYRRSIDEPWQEVDWDTALNHAAAEFRRIEARAERARWDRLGIPDDSKLNGWTADIAPASPFTIIRRNR